MEKTYYELSSSQRVLIFSQQFSLHKQLNNISTMMLIEGDVNMEVLKKAVQKSYERIDSLRLRLTKKGKGIYQQFLDNEEPYIEDLDLSGKTQAEADELFINLAQKRVTYYNRPLSRIYFVKNCMGCSGIYFVVSHLIIDSWGICIFFKDVMGIYEALINSTPYPPSPVPYRELLVKELEYKSSPRYVKDKEYWKKEFSKEDEPIFSHVNGPELLDKARKKHKDPSYRSACATNLFKAEAKHEICLIPNETVKRMKGFCSERRLPLQTMIMLGMRTYLSKVNRHEQDVSFYSVVARRGTLAEKNSGGSRVYFIPLRTVMPDNMTFGEALEMLSRKQGDIYRHSEYDPLDYFKLFKEQYGVRNAYSSCSLTFQPVPMCGPNGMKVHTKWYCNGTTGIPLYLTVMDDDGSGALRCYYEYQYKIVSKETVLRVHNAVLKVIESGLENENVTLKEILELDI